MALSAVLPAAVHSEQVHACLLSIGMMVMLMVVVMAAAGAVLVMLVMMMLVLVVIVVMMVLMLVMIVVMVMLMLLMIVVMMMLMLLVLIMVMMVMIVMCSLLQKCRQLIVDGILLGHGIGELLAGQLVPVGGNDGSLGILLTQALDDIIELVL